MPTLREGVAKCYIHVRFHTAVKLLHLAENYYGRQIVPTTCIGTLPSYDFALGNNAYLLHLPFSLHSSRYVRSTNSMIGTNITCSNEGCLPTTDLIPHEDLRTTYKYRVRWATANTISGSR